MRPWPFRKVLSGIVKGSFHVKEDGAISTLCIITCMATSAAYKRADKDKREFDKTSFN